MNRTLAISAVMLLIALSACNQKNKSSEAASAKRYGTYSGSLAVACDEGLQSIMKQEQEVFEFLYDSVKANISYQNEKEIFSDFKTGKAQVMLLARALSQAEINDLKNLDTIYVKELPVAYDAVALIGHTEFDDKTLDTNLLKRYFAPQGSSSSPRLVFDNQHSSLVRFVLDYLGYKEKVSPNVFAMQSAEEVIEYVSTNKNAIGFIPFNMISDTDDERVKKVLKRIKILSLRAKTAEGEEIRISANQSDIKTGDYPLVRTVNAVTRYTHEDNLESLFISFLSKEKGAKIFLKAGLIPAKMPERDIIVNESEVTGSK